MASRSRTTTRSCEMTDQPKPKQPIRRFDVFAEYNRLKALREGRPPDEAKGYGLWLAKVVASRRYAPAGSRQPDEGAERRGEAGEPPKEQERFRTLGGELQTDERFDREIVDRMGREFYASTFAPAIAGHFERGDRYEAIRDLVRKDWKP